MDIEKRMTFGRYKGLTLQSVFSGTQDIDRNLLAAYLRYRLSQGDIYDVDDEITVNMFNFVIDPTTLILQPTLTDFKGDASKRLEGFFRSGDSLGSKLINVSLDKFCYDIYGKNYDPPLNIGGVPEYIEWCIKTIDKFFINPHQISN